MINDLIKNIKTEYFSNMDNFSQDIIISRLETLLKYAERIYQRQFITRNITNHQILNQVEEILSTYLNNESQLSEG